MHFFEQLIYGYKDVLHFIAEFVVYSLEFVGIVIIVVGSIRALLQICKRVTRKQPGNVMISLGKALSLSLEFKMGAEIINTVIIRDLQELGVLAIVIIIRALLAVLIHWEMKVGREDEKEEHQKEQ